MQVHFRSKSEDYEVDFISEGIIEGKKYIFADKSLIDTTLIIEVINETRILLQRIGQTMMNINFILNQETPGTYENNLGLKFDFTVICKEIRFKKNSIYFKYDYYMDNELKSSHKIWIIIK